jgi:hypothetical protein
MKTENRLSLIAPTSRRDTSPEHGTHLDDDKSMKLEIFRIIRSQGARMVHRKIARVSRDAAFNLFWIKVERVSLTSANTGVAA